MQFSFGGNKSLKRVNTEIFNAFSLETLSILLKCCETILHVHTFRIIPKNNIDLNIVLNCLLLETLGNAFQQLMRFTSFFIISAAKCTSINTKRSRARQYLHETLRNAASLTMTRLADRFPKIFNPWADDDAPTKILPAD